jgi:2-oxoglutarate dehydrogenase E2 component (dihydrolipoamide succinyltransferase)/2-oxoisovalerate dehydrogenase E2 component (dihydrolipoyl transacylase)
MKAVITALKEFPILNSTWTEDGIRIKRYVNLGIATSIEDGLIVPVIRDADKKDFLILAGDAQDLAKRARDKKLRPDEVQEGTFTITNYGLGGSLFGNPIIVPNQAAILGIGAIQKRPVVIDDAIAVRSMVYLSLSFDHRILDGAQADRFMRSVKEILETWNYWP